MTESLNLYTGSGNAELPDFQLNASLNEPSLYKPSLLLQNAVNVSILLGKPLLITGEPGTGKTQLAYSVAHTFDLGKPLVFNTRTTSTATDLFYSYDALKHLQYAQLQNGLLPPLIWPEDNRLQHADTKHRCFPFRAQ